MTFRSWPSCGSATSTRVVFEPMSIAAPSISNASARSFQTARMGAPLACPLRGSDNGALRRRLGLNDGCIGMRGVLELAEQPGHHEGDLLAHVDGVVADPLDRARDQEHRHRPFAAVDVVADLQ